MTHETFYIYYTNADRKPAFLTNPLFEEGQIVQWGVSLNVADAQSFSDFNEAVKRAEELTCYSQEFGSDDPEAQDHNGYTSWGVVAGEISLRF